MNRFNSLQKKKKITTTKYNAEVKCAKGCMSVENVKIDSTIANKKQEELTTTKIPKTINKNNTVVRKCLQIIVRILLIWCRYESIKALRDLSEAKV